MHPTPVIRAASLLSYVVGIGTLLTLGPSLVSNLLTGDPAGNFLGPNPLGLPVVGAVLFGIAFLVATALEVVAGFWLGQSLRKGGQLGVILALSMTPLAIGLLLVAWLPVLAILIALIGMGWRTLG